MKNTAEKIKRSLTLCLYVIALSPLFYNTNYSLSQAATATWSLTSNGNSATTGNVTATAVSKGPGRPDYGGIGAMSHTADGVRSQNWNRSSYLSFSITSQYYNRDYYEYTVTPTPGNDFNVTSITLEASASTNSPSWFVYYSLDGFATYTQLGVRNSTSLTGLTITVPSGSTLTLRIFGMDLLASTTYFRNRNVVISGTTSLGCSAPTQPSTITGNGTICANANGTYSVTNDPVATSYTWTLPSGWTGSSSTNSISATSGANGGTITVTANNACGTSTQRTFNVTTAAAPAQPSSIAGSTSICVNANGTYSVTNDPAATSYTWTLPSGWTGSSTTNSINATSGANGGTITVTANNACGNSTQQTVNVTTTGAPTQPSSIAGSTSICVNANGTYSVTNDPAATSYTWTLPSGWTGSSTTNSINATSGANGGTITVTANNACGTSSQQTFNVTTAAAPAQPSSITGSTSICANANGTYSVTNDPAATSYTWTLPSGWTGSSTTNSINATSGANGGTITVTANNACGTSSQQTFNVTTAAAPAQPSTITGNGTICANANGTYSVTNDPAATGYTWTLPSGWTGSSTTNSINATSGANGGTITVTANNTCGASAQQLLTVSTTVIDNTVSLSGSTLTANQSGAVYQWINCTAGNVPVSGATSQSFTPASNGTYAVEIMHNGCSELSSCIAVSSVGVESVAMNSFDVYPNPGNGLYTISSKYALEPSQVKIYTASGQLINASAIVSQDKQLLIDISNQPEGIYIVSFSTPSSSFHLRISKQ